MITPDDAAGFWKNLAEWMSGAALALIGLVWTDSKVEIKRLAREKVTKEAMDAHLAQYQRDREAIDTEQERQRKDIRQIFDLMRESEAESQKRHSELLKAIYGKGGA